MTQTLELPSLFGQVAEMVRGLPATVARKLMPTNPAPQVSWYRSLDLAHQGRLALTAVTELGADPAARWLVPLDLLEERGIRKGVSVQQVADRTGWSKGTAKKHMLAAEKQIYDMYGLNVCFAEHNGNWRLATDEEVAAKYRRQALEIERKVDRMRMYLPHAARLFKPRADSVQLTLFELPESEEHRHDGGNAAD